MCRAPIKSISRQASLVSTSASMEASDCTAIGCDSAVELTIENSMYSETQYNNIDSVTSEQQSGDSKK